jgi:hypothetical protein
MRHGNVPQRRLGKLELTKISGCCETVPWCESPKNGRSEGQQ